MKPHYRLHFHSFDGKLPMWWVSRRYSFDRGRATGGFSNPGDAIRAAAKL